jgi:hypothetical protein
MIFSQHNRIGGVTVSVLASRVVDRGFSSGVTVSVLASRVVDRGFSSGVTVSVLASRVVDRGFKPRSGQTKDYEIGICCICSKHSALRRKGKYWFARNQIMCPSGATCLSTDCCEVAQSNPTKCVVLVHSRPHHLIDNYLLATL